jgi:hypothetical protein
MIAFDCPEDVQKKLADHGVEVLWAQNPRRLSHFQTWRYIPALEWLKPRAKDFRFVLWTDVFDVVFQEDPFVFMERNRYRGHLVAAKEGRLIKNEGINTEWMRRLCSGAELEYNLNQEVLCSGTIGGSSHTMVALFEQMVQGMNGISSIQGIDQGLFNLIVRRSFSPSTYVPEMEEGFISTCGMFLSANNPPDVWTVEHPYFDRTEEPGTIWTNNRSKKFAIQHCYNRHHGLYDPNGDWRGIVEARYRA